MKIPVFEASRRGVFVLIVDIQNTRSKGSFSTLNLDLTSENSDQSSSVDVHVVTMAVHEN